jgi:hypothetical protein
MTSSRQHTGSSRNLLIVGLLLSATGLAGYILWLSTGVLVRDGNWVGVDFQVYYQAAKALARGENIYTAGISPPYVYPPLLSLLAYPLSILPITPATILWKLLQHLCLFIAGALLAALSPKGVRPLVVGVLLLSLLLVPFHDEIRVGESNSLILALVVGSIALAARATNDNVLASSYSDSKLAIGGGLLALAVSIKVLPVLLLAYFWWRGPRVIAAWATGLFVTLQLFTLVVTPTNTVHYWLVEFPGLFGQAFPFLDNQSLNAFFSRALVPGDPAYPSTQIAGGELLRPILTWLSNLAVIAASLRVLSRFPSPLFIQDPTNRNVRLLLEVGLVLLTTHLVSGSTWLHHLIALAVPVAGLLGVWWLLLEIGYRVSGIGWMARVGGLLLAGVALAWEPEELVLLADRIAPANESLALFSSTFPMLVVIGLWIAVARAISGLQQASSPPA